MSRFDDEICTGKVSEAGHANLRHISWSMARACSEALRRRGVESMDFRAQTRAGLSEGVRRKQRAAEYEEDEQ